MNNFINLIDTTAECQFTTNISKIYDHDDTTTECQFTTNTSKIYDHMIVGYTHFAFE